MGKRILEGTWDELAAHADELRGYKHLRLIIPEKASTPEEQGIDGPSLAEVLAPLLEEAKHIQREKPVPLTDPYEIAVSEIIAEKYRKMGFKP